jgi:hypothetical protein
MKIRLSEKVASGAPFVVPALLRRLDALHKDPAGAHVLSTLGATVQIELRVGAYVGTPCDGAEVDLHARDRLARAFPVFDGTLRIEPVDAFSSLLVLAGNYRVPAGLIGEGADHTMFAGAAKRSLQKLLAEIESELSVSVRLASGVPA